MMVVTFKQWFNGVHSHTLGSSRWFYIESEYSAFKSVSVNGLAIPNHVMFVCQWQFAHQKHTPVVKYHSSYCSTCTTDVSTMTDCSSSWSGCLGNVIGSRYRDSENQTSVSLPTRGTTTTTTTSLESHSRGFQRRRRRPVYFSSSNGSIASTSPDGQMPHNTDLRRRRPVQPWHIQQQRQQEQKRLLEVQYHLANLPTMCTSSFGSFSQKHPVTLVDSSWWPVSQPSFVCIYV